MSRYLGNFIGNVYVFYYFIKYCVIEIMLIMVKEGVIGNVDKELVGGVVFVSGMCYRDGVMCVVQVVIGFIFDWWVWFFLLYLFGEIVVLNYKVRNDVVKGSVVIKIVVYIIDKVLYRYWCFLFIQFQFDVIS